MTPHPHLRTIALASLRRWPGVRWFVWTPAATRTRPNARPWIVATRQAPAVDFFRAMSRT